MTPIDKPNPAYIYGVVASGLTLLIGLGVIQFTDAQTDLVLKFVAAVILAISGTAVGAGSSVNGQVEEALEMTPPSQSIIFTPER